MISSWKSRSPQNMSNFFSYSRKRIEVNIFRDVDSELRVAQTDVFSYQMQHGKVPLYYEVCTMRSSWTLKMCFAFEMKNILWMGRYSYSCNIRDNTNKNQRNKEGEGGRGVPRTDLGCAWGWRTPSVLHGRTALVKCSNRIQTKNKVGTGCKNENFVELKKKKKNPRT